MRIVAIVTARMTSSRLPGKVLLNLAGKPSIERHIERIRMAKGISDIYIATSKAKENRLLFEEAERLSVNIYAGADEDIVERFVSVGESSEADALVRIGCDKPLFCYELLQNNLNAYHGEDYIYLKKGVTIGIGHEILSLKALKEVHKHYHGTAIAQYIREHPHKFNISSVDVDPVYKRPEYRLALDTAEDYQLLKVIFNKNNSDKPIHTRKVLMYLDDNPKEASINRNFNEKNVNRYSMDIENKPIFKVQFDNDGKYIALDRMGDQIDYQDFVKCVMDAQRWARRNKDA